MSGIYSTAKEQMLQKNLRGMYILNIVLCKKIIVHYTHMHLHMYSWFWQ